jgi:hypothetical protein
MLPYLSVSSYPFARDAYASILRDLISEEYALDFMSNTPRINIPEFIASFM